MKLIAKNVDITTLEVDAIVNAANPVMRGGGGVDGAIHRAAGPKLREACEMEHPHGCATGQARVTSGFDLPAKFVIHTVGPDMREVISYGLGERLLSSCYWQCIMMADNMGLKTIAFPAISTGVYGFNKEKAAKIAVEELLLNFDDLDIEVTFACFGDGDTAILQAAIDNLEAKQ